MSCPQAQIALVVLVLGASLPSRVRAQIPPAPDADSSLRNTIALIGADNPRSVRLASRESGRIEGRRAYVLGDSVLLDTEFGVRSFAVANVDSVWAQQGTAALLVGMIAGVPCALFGAMVGEFIGGDPDSKGSPGRSIVGLFIGFLGGGFVCGSVGAGIGSLIRRWRLEYPLAAEDAA